MVEIEAFDVTGFITFPSELLILSLAYSSFITWAWILLEKYQGYISSAICNMVGSTLLHITRWPGIWEKKISPPLSAPITQGAIKYKTFQERSLLVWCSGWKFSFQSGSEPSKERIIQRNGRDLDISKQAFK